MTVGYTKRAAREFARLDKAVRSRVRAYMQVVAESDDPRKFGRALSGNLAGLWRYRVGDWRVVCDIQDERLLILVVDVGHRREVYR